MRLADASIAAAFLRGPSDSAAVVMIGEGIAQKSTFRSCIHTERLAKNNSRPRSF
jgi:hypothetical protein